MKIYIIKGKIPAVQINFNVSIHKVFEKSDLLHDFLGFRCISTLTRAQHK